MGIDEIIQIYGDRHRSQVLCIAPARCYSRCASDIRRANHELTAPTHPKQSWSHTLNTSPCFLFDLRVSSDQEAPCLAPTTCPPSAQVNHSVSRQGRRRVSSCIAVMARRLGGPPTATGPPFVHEFTPPSITHTIPPYPTTQMTKTFHRTEGARSPCPRPFSCTCILSLDYLCDLSCLHRFLTP